MSKLSRAEELRNMPVRSPLGPVVYALLLACLCSLAPGCAAITNPVANGIPVRLLPPELLADSREGLEQVPLDWLRQKPPEIYTLAPGDILGVYIEGVLGERSQLPPVSIPEGDLPPSLGFPIPIREDGTVPLPLIKPLKLEGLSISEAEDKVIWAYTEDTQILQKDRARILVTMLRQRSVRVLVVRQDSFGGGVRLQNRGPLSRSGLSSFSLTSGRPAENNVVVLPAYQNDVLNALTRTGGLPGLDAFNEVIVQRGGQRATENEPFDPENTQITRIPLRLPPGQAPPFTQQDIILEDGDIVFIQSREGELYYTGGLLPSAELPLPRDYDLDIVEAVVRVSGPLLNGGITSNNLSGTIVQGGIGNPSPSNLTVIRRLEEGGIVHIHVDLNRALVDPRENILVRAGDILVLQETPGEAFARYASGILRFNFFGELYRRSGGVGTATAALFR